MGVCAVLLSKWHGVEVGGDTYVCCNASGVGCCVCLLSLQKMAASHSNPAPVSTALSLSCFGKQTSTRGSQIRVVQAVFPFQYQLCSLAPLTRISVS